MVKVVLIILFLSVSLVFSGCGESEGESRLETQQMLDEGNYAGVISKLEGNANSNEDYIALGAAYMGKAGFSLADIVSAISSSSEDDDAFAGFVISVADQRNSNAITDLDTSTSYYQKVVQNRCLDTNATLSDSQKDVCLYIGLAHTTTAAVALNHIAGDVSTFGSENNGTDNKLQASTCAMQYALDGGSDTNVDASCTVTPDSNVTFTILEKDYNKFTVDVNATSFYYLMNENNQTVLTDGFCSETDFATRVDDYNASLHACPINEDKDKDELTTAGVLVNVLNEGIGSIGGASTQDIQGDVDEFKCDILNGTYDEFNGCTDILNNPIDITVDITELDIINYLNNENS